MKFYIISAVDQNSREMVGVDETGQLWSEGGTVSTNIVINIKHCYLMALNLIAVPPLLAIDKVNLSFAVTVFCSIT